MGEKIPTSPRGKAVYTEGRDGPGRLASIQDVHQDQSPGLLLGEGQVQEHPLDPRAHVQQGNIFWKGVMALKIGYYLGPEPVIAQEDIAAPQNQNALAAVFRHIADSFCQPVTPGSSNLPV